MRPTCKTLRAEIRVLKVRRCWSPASGQPLSDLGQIESNRRKHQRPSSRYASVLDGESKKGVSFYVFLCKRWQRKGYSIESAFDGDSFVFLFRFPFSFSLFRPTHVVETDATAVKRRTEARRTDGRHLRRPIGAATRRL